MGLIEVDAHTDADLAHWESIRFVDEMHGESISLKQKVERSVSAIRNFLKQDDRGAYAGVSWGKDSTVLAHLIAEHYPGIPVVFARVWPITNPHCLTVRDRFLDRFNVDYNEYQVKLEADEQGWRFVGSVDECFRRARVVHGPRHISGVRADESTVRKIRMCKYGHNSKNTCAPLGWWSGQDIFGYLARHDLPIHPAYAMTMGGGMDRNRIRVDMLGDERGQSMGRLSWERRYYQDRFHELAKMWEARTGRTRSSWTPFHYVKSEES